MTTIRPASPQDVEILREAFGDLDHRTLIEDPGTPRAGSWVAESEGRVVGFAHFREGGDATRGEIRRLDLLDAARATGAARMLLDAMLDDMRVVGFAVAVVSLAGDDPRAGRFYEGAGFDLEGDGGPEADVVRYRLAL